MTDPVTAWPEDVEPPARALVARRDALVRRRVREITGGSRRHERAR